MPIPRPLTPKPLDETPKRLDDTADIPLEAKPDDIDNEEHSTHGAFLFLCKVKRAAERSALQELS